MARLIGDELAAQCICCEYWTLDFIKCSECGDEYCDSCALEVFENEGDGKFIDDICQDCRSDINITHWMHLPEPPKEPSDD